MRKECEEIQIKVVTIGMKAASADPAVQAHLASCPLCAEFAHSAADLETTEGDLEEYDVPDDVFARTISEVKKAQAAITVANAGREEGAERKSWLRYLFDPIIAPALVMGLCGVLVLTITYRNDGSIQVEKAGRARNMQPAPVREAEAAKKLDAQPPSPVLADRLESRKDEKSIQLEGSAGLDKSVAPQKPAAAAAPRENSVALGRVQELGAARQMEQQAEPRMKKRPLAADMEQDSMLMEQAELAPSFDAPGFDAPAASAGAGLQGLKSKEAKETQPSLQAAADAVTEGRFADARVIVETYFPMSVVPNERKSADEKQYKVYVISGDRGRILAALNDIQRPGHDTPEARAALRSQILNAANRAARDPRPALE